MQTTAICIGLAALICTGLTLSQYLHATAPTYSCTSEIRSEQLRDIRATVRHLTIKWTADDERLLDIVSIVTAEKLGLSNLQNTHQ